MAAKRLRPVSPNWSICRCRCSQEGWIGASSGIDITDGCSGSPNHRLVPLSLSHRFMLSRSFTIYIYVMYMYVRRTLLPHIGIFQGPLIVFKSPTSFSAMETYPLRSTLKNDFIRNLNSLKGVHVDSPDDLRSRLANGPWHQYAT